MTRYKYHGTNDAKIWKYFSFNHLLHLLPRLILFTSQLKEFMFNNFCCLRLAIKNILNDMKYMLAT